MKAYMRVLYCRTMDAAFAPHDRGEDPSLLKAAAAAQDFVVAVEAVLPRLQVVRPQPQPPTTCRSRAVW